MEAEIFYIAKDGTKFHDALACQEYEARIGTAAGTVAKAKLDLQTVNKDKYVCGLLMVEHGGKTCLNSFVTRNIDHELEDYVNPENIAQEKRYIIQTMEDVLQTLTFYNDDDCCEYFLTFSDNIQMTDCGVTHTLNSRLWNKIKERNNTCKTE